MAVVRSDWPKQTRRSPEARGKWVIKLVAYGSPAAALQMNGCKSLIYHGNKGHRQIRANVRKNEQTVEPQAR